MHLFSVLLLFVFMYLIELFHTRLLYTPLQEGDLIYHPMTLACLLVSIPTSAGFHHTQRTPSAQVHTVTSHS